MDIHHLRYAVALAQDLHFTRAAKRLGIAQPPLSQRIKDLERELGVLLFRRLTRGVELTKAGEAFIPFAKSALQTVEMAKEAAKRAARGEIGTLSIGFTSSASFNPLVTSILSKFRNAYPDITVALSERATSALVEGFQSGSIDVAFLRPALGEMEGLATVRLPDEDLCVALPPNHRLASARRLRLIDLAGDPFILFPRTNGRQLYDGIIAACRDAGFSPDIVQEAPQLTSTINLVAAGVGVAIVPKSIGQLRAPGVSFVSITGSSPKALLMIAHRKEGPINPGVRNFMLSAAQTMANSSEKKS